MKWFGFCLLIPAVLWCGSVVSNRLALRENLIRLHVVAASDSEEDQAVKLRVRDALISALEAPMAGITDKDEARACLQEKLPELQSIAQRVLLNSGCEAPVLVSLTEEAFDTRVYDTFTLPAGVYDTLRVTIGEGEGRNWWCVVFPTLCLPATSEGFEELARTNGMDAALACALSGEDGYELRFYFLDLLGNLENMWYNG